MKLKKVLFLVLMMALVTSPFAYFRFRSIRNAESAPVLPIMESSLETPTSSPQATATEIVPVIQNTPIPFNPATSITDLANPAEALITRSLIASRASKLAAETMPGKYSWEEFRSCSTFVSAYLRQLSFPVSGRVGQYGSYPDPFPWSGTVEQVDWARRNYPQYVHDAPLTDFLEGRLWDKIAPGDIIYLQTDVGHNGYNTYYHTVVLVGYEENGSPLFSELASGMKNVSLDSTFSDMTSFYSFDANGWHVDPAEVNPNTVSSPLMVTWFDPLAILNQRGLWAKTGPVVPNSDLIKSTFDNLITINIYDGTATLWEKVDGVWIQVSLNDRSEFYAVTGRYLPANKTIQKTFLQNRKHEIYDGDYGVYLSNTGVYQHTWTPQMVAELRAFDYIDGFGGLSGSTLTALMVPQIYDKKGHLVDNWDYSSFTFHRIPDVVNQDMLLRVDLLKKANALGSPDFGSIPVPQVYLSSGCINFDETTWTMLQNYLQSQIDADRRVGIIFSYPDFDQNLLPTIDLFKSAFTGGEFNKWCFNNKETCDGLDRRQFRKTYLDQ